MASYQGTAWIDLIPGADPDRILDLVRARRPEGDPGDLYGWADGARVVLSTGDGYHQLPDLAVAAMRETGAVRGACVAMDHDEYGAEHVIMADGKRLQHVYTYPRTRLGLPYRDNRPWRTDLPAGVRSRGSRWWGHLVDGPEAWSAVAELYGADAREVERAVYEGRRACPPFGPLLTVLGLDHPDGRPVQLWPGPAWRDAAIRYALPHLPGRWLAEDDDLIMLPIGPIARVITRGVHQPHVYLGPLYLPWRRPFPAGWEEFARDCDPPAGVWDRFVTVPGGERYMTDLVALVREQIHPFLRREGTLEGYAARCRRRIGTGSAVSPVDHCRLGFTEAVRGRFGEAVAALDDAVAAAGAKPAHASYAEHAAALRRAIGEDPAAARAALLDAAADRRRDLGLPPGD